MVTVEHTVTGMTWGHCEMSVREGVQQVAGVSAIDVSAAAGRLFVSGEQPIDDTAILAAVEEAGYQAVRA